MIVTKKVSLFLLGVGLWFGLTARGAETMKEAIATLPSDALGFICVPSLKQLDANYQQAISDLGLQAMIQPPMNSLVGAIKQFAPMFASLDETGVFALVFMPAETVEQLGSSMAVLIPAGDPKGMLEGMGGQAGEGGIWTVNLYGQPAFAAAGEKRVFVAKTADVAKKVVANKGGLDSKLKPADLKSLEGLDVALWVDGERLLKLLKPQIDMMTSMIMMMQSGGGALGAKQGEATKQQIDMFVEGAASASLGVSLKKPGLDLRFAMTAKPGTELAKRNKIKTTTSSLLTGVAPDKYMLVFGGISDPAQVQTSMKDLDPYIGMLESIEGVGKETVGQLRSVVEEWASLMTGVRGCIEALAPGPEGLFGVSLLMETSDSQKWVDLAGRAVETGKKLLSEAKSTTAKDDIKKVLEAITHNPDAEQVGGAKVGHLKFDVAKIEGVDEEDLEEMTKVLGKHGLLFRIAAADAKTVVVTFGGGTSYLTRSLEAAKKKDAPLDNDGGIKKVSAHLPNDRASVAYIAVDNVIAGIQNALKALDEEDLPFKMPALQAPLAITSTGQAESVRMDVFFPTELLVAGKNVVMALQGGNGDPDAPSKSASGSAAPTESKKEEPK